MHSVITSAALFLENWQTRLVEYMSNVTCLSRSQCQGGNFINFKQISLQWKAKFIFATHIFRNLEILFSIQGILFWVDIPPRMTIGWN